MTAVRYLSAPAPGLRRGHPATNRFRIITKVEEVRALPDGAIVLTRYGMPAQIHDHIRRKDPSFFDYVVEGEGGNPVLVLLERPLEVIA